MFLLSAASGLFGAGGAAATAATAATGAAAAAGPGLSLSSILSGVATVGGFVSSIMAGNAEADAARAAAIDAEREQSLENLQGINRRRSLKAAAAEALGEQDAAYAASGVDLSFGSAAEARRRALRETDMALTSDGGTQETRVARLQERAANYRRQAGRARMAGVISGITGVAGVLRGRG